MRALLLASAMLAIAGAAQAQSLERGQCLPTADMVSRLRAERQRAVITGEAVMLGAANLAAPLPVTYTSDPSGTRGYELTTQRRSGSEALCVSEVLANVRLAHPERREVRAFYLPGSVSDEDARRIGRDEGIPNARGLNMILDFGAGSGFYAALQASIVGPNRETLTVLTLPRTVESMTYRSDRRGVTTLSYVMQRSGLTPYATELLAR